MWKSDAVSGSTWNLDAVEQTQLWGRHRRRGRRKLDSTQVGWGFYVFVVRPFKFYQFVLFVISLWILQVVLKFWRYLSAVDPARARVLASPRRRHAASQAAHNERAVRRLESGASSGES